MKISDEMLLTIERSRKVLTVQSDFPDIVYAVGHGEVWIINKQTGAQLEISAENVYAFTDELISVAEVHLNQACFNLQSPEEGRAL
ncbi:MAG: hypothetical protein ABFD25_00790 [Clostridiaceae bacterium]